MKKRNIIATSGIVTSLILSGSNPALAQSNQTNNPPFQRTINLTNKTDDLIEDEINLDTEINAQDILDQDTRDIKEAFSAQGFSLSQIQSLLGRSNKANQGSDWFED